MNSPESVPQPGPPNGGDANNGSPRNFLNRLFDSSFSEFVTPSIVKVLFTIGVLMATVAALFILVGSVARGGITLVVGVIVAPLAFLLYVMLLRVVLEVYLVLFKIEENTRN